MKKAFRMTIAALGLAFITVSSISVQAEDYTYVTNNGTVTITKYIGSGGTVSIPYEIDGFPVTDIGPNAFNSCSSLTMVNLPESVTNIGEASFSYSTNLSSVTIPDSMASTISIGDFAFAGCTSLTNVSLGEGVTSIGMMAFAGFNGLTYITMPGNVTNIGYAVFWNCLNLMGIHVKPQNTAFSSRDGVLFDKNQTTLIAFPPGRNGAYTVPNTVTTIGDSAFGSGNLTNVTIPQSVSYIGYSSFLSAHITAVYFLGDCPILHSNAFTCADLILYYLPGTAGWSPIIGERTALPLLLRQPVILGFGPSFGVQTNAFGFRISWATNSSVVVEASTNLSSWLPVSTNALVDGWVDFSDAESARNPTRFYQVRQW